MKKGQLTIFIILGLVIISIFGFVFFATVNIQRQEQRAQAERVINEILQTTSLRFYVNQCTEKALQNGIDLLSKQGGKIFPEQRGSLMLPESSEKAFQGREGDKIYLISYGILNGSSSLPKYPCSSDQHEYDTNAFCAYSSQNKRFDNWALIGKINLPALCKDFKSGCDSRYAKWDTRFSVQAQLENYISDYVKDCVDFESLVGINSSYNITEGEISTTISMTGSEVKAKVDYPLVFAPIGSQPVVRLLNFQSSISTRFKEAYYFARYAVVNDVTSPAAATFNIKTGTEEAIKKKHGENSGFVVDVQKNIMGRDYLVKITDTKADPAFPLTVQFLVQNRPPVLDYLEGDLPREICDTYDMKRIQEKTAEISPSAFDPDEDEISFSYSGWLEDYDEFLVVQSTTTPESLCPDVVQQISFYADKESERRWERDSDFRKNGKAKAELTDDDVGFHKFNITVCDASLCDYQEIRIFVDDIIRVVVEKANIFGTEQFSLEDPMIFIARVQDLYKDYIGTSTYEFLWTIEDPNFLRSYTDLPKEEKLILPVNDNGIGTIAKSYNDMKIDGISLFRKNNQYFFHASVDAGGYEEESSTEAIPIQCIPFTGTTTSPPYPYNTTNPYVSDHLCCNPTTNEPYSSSASKICFDEATYGTFASFDLDKYKNEYDTANSLISNPTSQGFSSPYTDLPNAVEEMQEDLLNGEESDKTKLASSESVNDIIKRQFTRKCDGTRGNICVGSMTETFSIFKNCVETNPVAGQTGTCYGPSKIYTKTETSPSTSPLYCVHDYSGTTLERELGITEEITCTLNTLCVLNNNDANGYVSSISGHYLCNATCSSAGCTRTQPNICHNCYEDQTCSSDIGNFLPANPTYDMGHKITVRSFTSCSVGECGLTTLTDYSDVCLDSETIRDYYCVSQNNIGESSKPYLYSDKKCIDFPNHEKQAEDEDDSKIPDAAHPSEKHNCIQYEVSTCITISNGPDFCKSPDALTTTTFTDGHWYGEKPGDSSPKHWYREYYEKNNVGNVYIAETCEIEYYDFDDLDPQFCTSAGGSWVDESCQWPY
ncbi:hypothetical protein JXB27_00805 [Candidatus Woesearchaeota archaeon]|nr:hypothetical protein [Candidatus Woesearchaeota archaeon]